MKQQLQSKVLALEQMIIMHCRNLSFLAPGTSLKAMVDQVKLVDHKAHGERLTHSKKLKSKLDKRLPAF